MSCKICRRETEEGVYCPQHGLAYSNLEDGYKRWRYALGPIWVEYRVRINKKKKSPSNRL